MATLTHPLPGAITPTGGYLYGTPRWTGIPHPGVDFIRPNGTCGARVEAAADGTATRALDAWGGRGVKIDHGGGVETRYWHLQSQLVADGQPVRAGQLIATAGNSGTNVGGCHLHFEVWLNGAHRDPLPYLGGAAIGTGPVDDRMTIEEALRTIPGSTRLGNDSISVPSGVSCPPGWRGGFLCMGNPPGSDCCIRPGEGPLGLKTPGEVVEEQLGAILPVVVNVAVIGGALLIGWTGVKQVLGIGTGR